MASVRRYLLTTILGVAALLLPAAVRADSLRADFDGDGVRDHIEVAARSTELAVRLSTDRTPQRLQADDLILRYVIADVNRDGHPDVVASTRRSASSERPRVFRQLIAPTSASWLCHARGAAAIGLKPFDELEEIDDADCSGRFGFGRRVCQQGHGCRRIRVAAASVFAGHTCH